MTIVAAPRIVSAFLQLGGDVAEFGVFRGASLNDLAGQMQDCAKTLWGFDSFQGMAQPDPSLDDCTAYPEGKFGNTTCGVVIQNLMRGRQDYVTVKLKEGWLPDVLPHDEEFQQTQFCFAHVDLDHFKPTLGVAREVWPRLVDGGGLCFDDFYPHGAPLGATAAINVFLIELEKRGELYSAQTLPNTLLVCKGALGKRVGERLSALIKEDPFA